MITSLTVREIFLLKETKSVILKKYFLFLKVEIRKTLHTTFSQPKHIATFLKWKLKILRLSFILYF